MLRAISQTSSRIHRARVCDQTHAISLITRIRDTVAQAISVITAKAAFAIAPRLAYLAENADACALDTSSCVLLTLFGSARVSPHVATEPRHAACGGLQRLKVHARCIRDSLFSPPASPSLPLGLAPPRLARFVVGIARVERHRARRPQLSWQFVLNARGTTFSAEGWMHRCTAAPSRIFAGKVARRRSRYSR